MIFQACNGNNFVKISRSTMNALVVSAESRANSGPPCYYEDEATGFSSEDDYADYYEEAGPPVPSTNRKWDLCK